MTATDLEEREQTDGPGTAMYDDVSEWRDAKDNQRPEATDWEHARGPLVALGLTTIVMLLPWDTWWGAIAKIILIPTLGGWVGTWVVLGNEVSSSTTDKAQMKRAAVVLAGLGVIFPRLWLFYAFIPLVILGAPGAAMIGALFTGFCPLSQGTPAKNIEELFDTLSDE